MDDDRPSACNLPAAQASLATLLCDLLSSEEVDQIVQQFNHECRPDSQVLWSGIPKQIAQAWARKRNLQTLTTAMGPLMDSQHSSCLKRIKSTQQWGIYIKGASALFAYHITRQSSKVTVLLPPPPQKLNPNGHTNYQLLEEPILKGLIGGHSIGCVQMVHPTVKGAETFTYQSWPIDETEEWTKKFSLSTIVWTSWRSIRLNKTIQHIIAIVTVAKDGNPYTESVTTLPSEEDVLAQVKAYMTGKEKASIFLIVFQHTSM